MGLRLAISLSLVVQTAVATFVWRTCALLPTTVASHFKGSGLADTFMSRDAYSILILSIVIAVPLLITILPLIIPMNKTKRRNIPHSGFWFAPERREQTINFLRIHGLAFPPAISLLLGYFHWLTVKANEFHPPMMSHSAAITGLLVFFGYLAIWIAILFVRFRKTESF